MGENPFWRDNDERCAELGIYQTLSHCCKEGLGLGLLLIWTLVPQCGPGIGTWEAVSRAGAQALLRPVESETLGWGPGACWNTLS